MSSNPPLTPEEIQDIIVRYYKNGESQYSIAFSLGRHQTTIGRYVRKYKYLLEDHD